MRLLIYNIAYGTGNPGGEAKRLLTAHRYLRASRLHFRRIIRFIRHRKPDMVGLIETDSGSFRTAGESQPAKLAELFLGRELLAESICKYGPRSWLSKLPYLSSQTNALLSASPDREAKRHYLPCGAKRLVLELECGGITVFLVHLSLRAACRAKQLAALAELLPRDRPAVLAGDFNTFRGEGELADFLGKTGMRPAGRAPTYPGWKPAKQLDYILVSEEVEVTDFEAPDIRLSDHLPLIAELTLRSPRS